jgi:hypothetical protein
VVSLALLGLSSCAAEPVSVSSPPAPGQDSSAPKFDYKHTIQKVQERRPVVALLRPKDLVDLKDYLPFGRKKVVLQQEGDQVKRFEVQGEEDAPVLASAEQRLFLMRELTRSREVILVERERIFEIVRELEFGETKYVDKDTKPKIGNLLGVHYILEPAFFPGGTQPAQSSVWAELAKHASGRRKAEVLRAGLVVAYLSAYDVQTGHVVAVAYGAGRTDAEAAGKVVEDLVDQLAGTSPPIRVIRFDEKGNPVLDIGYKDGVKPGDRFTVRTADGEAIVEAAKVDPFQFIGRILKGTKKALEKGAVAHRQQEAPVEKPKEPPI